MARASYLIAKGPLIQKLTRIIPVLIILHHVQGEKVVVALTLLFLAVLFRASAGEPLRQSQTTLENTTLGGTSNYTVNAGSPGSRIGIAGQVFEVLPILDLNDGLGFPSAPIQLRMWVYMKVGRNFRFVKSFDTASDGTFSFPALLGTYEIEPDPATGFVLGGYFNQFTELSEITVAPRQLTYDNIYVMDFATFPNLY